MIYSSGSPGNTSSSDVPPDGQRGKRQQKCLRSPLLGLACEEQHLQEGKCNLIFKKTVINNFSNTMFSMWYTFLNFFMQQVLWFKYGLHKMCSVFCCIQLCLVIIESRPRYTISWYNDMQPFIIILTHSSTFSLFFNFNLITKWN